jgi:hypothetical protein
MFFPALLSPHFRTTHPVRQTIYDLPSLSAAAAAIILDARYRPLLALITDMLTLVRPLLAPKPFPLSSNRCPVTFFLPLQGDRSSSHFFRRTGRLVSLPDPPFFLFFSSTAIFPFTTTTYRDGGEWLRRLGLVEGGRLRW